MQVKTIYCNSSVKCGPTNRKTATQHPTSINTIGIDASLHVAFFAQIAKAEMLVCTCNTAHMDSSQNSIYYSFWSILSRLRSLVKCSYSDKHILIPTLLGVARRSKIFILIKWRLYECRSILTSTKINEIVYSK